MHPTWALLGSWPRFGNWNLGLVKSKISDKGTICFLAKQMASWHYSNKLHRWAALQVDLKCYQTRILEQNTSQVWSQNHSFYKESKIQAVSYEICALKWFSCDPARPQIGSRKNIWSKSTETIHAFF